MKVFIGDKKTYNQYREKGDYFWVDDGEILYEGWFRYVHHIYLNGINSGKGTTIFKVIDLPISKEEFAINLKTSLERVYDGGKDEPLSDFEEFIDIMTKRIEPFSIGDVCRVKGFECKRIDHKPKRNILTPVYNLLERFQNSIIWNYIKFRFLNLKYRWKKIMMN